MAYIVLSITEPMKSLFVCEKLLTGEIDRMKHHTKIKEP